MQRKRLLRITTVPISLHLLLHGQLNFMQDQGFEVLAVSCGGKEVAYLMESGIPHRSVMLTRKITPLKDLIATLQLIAIILRFKPDIVHTHTPKAGLLGMLAAWLCRVPVRLHTVAGLPLMESDGWKRKLLVSAEKLTYFLATRVYPNSTGLMEFIRTELGLEKKMKIIGKGSSNGIDAHFFKRSDELMGKAKKIRNQFEIRDGELVFGFVGRIVKDKGIIELTQAFRTMSNEIPVRLMLIGPFEEETGPLPEDVKRFIQQDARVILPGFQPDIRPWFLAVDIFVFPSYREGFPNVVMQAACLGVPCIVSDINGCNELIQNQHSGLVVPAKNSEALYQAMKALAENPAERGNYALRAREYVVANFDQQTIWEELLKEYLFCSKLLNT